MIFGIWQENARLKFYAPQNNEHVSHSVLNLQKTSDFFEAQCHTPSYIMNMLAHDHLDLVKLDIEGAEYAVLDCFIKDGIKPRVLCVEFDEGHNPQDKKYVYRIQNAITQLINVGYQVTYRDLWDFTFVDSSCLK